MPHDHHDIVLCPGQGAQYVGMGKAWAERHAVGAKTFEEANDVLGFDLAKVCFDGPEDELNRTDVAQAAIYTTSVACYRVMQYTGDLQQVGKTAGLSLGEFTALHIAGAYDFDDGLKLVRLRGEAMQEAAESANDSGMVALIGVEEAQARELCDKVLAELNDTNEVLVPANFNCPGQIVISGSSAAWRKAVKVAEEMGLRAAALTVAGAFHSPLMQPAADQLAAALDGVEWRSPHLPVIANVTARPHDAEDIHTIKQRLVEQLTHPVKWSQSMQYLVGADTEGRMVELAPGKVLSGLMRRVDRKRKVANFDVPPE